MERKETIKCRIIHAKTTPKKLNDVVTDTRDGGEEIRDNSSPSEAPLPSRKHITPETSSPPKKEEDDTRVPKISTRLPIRPVIKSAEPVEKDDDKKP